jgi:hypothetical protein
MAQSLSVPMTAAYAHVLMTTATAAAAAATVTAAYDQ